MTGKSARELTKAEMVDMIISLRSLLANLPLDPNVDVDTWAQARCRVLDATDVKNDLVSVPFTQITIPARGECPEPTSGPLLGSKPAEGVCECGRPAAYYHLGSDQRMCLFCASKGCSG